MLGKAAEKFAESAADFVSGMVGNTGTQRPIVALSQKNILMHNVYKNANRGEVMDYDVVSSVAFEGLRRDYLRLCCWQEGGLAIVYEKHGMGKSHALQGVARVKSMLQPHRFLVINILHSTKTCAELYECIQAQLGVANLGLSPDEVAEVVRYGLLGPQKHGAPAHLPPTVNGCRLSIESTFKYVEKNINFPILVIDEFNPIDFTDDDWPDGTDFNLQQLVDKMGDALKFFSQLTGLAHAQNGFVVFLGTRSSAVARALLKLNEGTKAALTPCTKRNPRGTQFEDWKGFDWTDDGKRSLLSNLYENKYKKALRGQEEGLSDEYKIDSKWLYAVGECMTVPDIRGMCDRMQVELEAENGKVEAEAEKREVEVEVEKDPGGGSMQNRTQDMGAGCCFDFKGQVRDDCTIM
jgi:hypothetical protein